MAINKTPKTTPAGKFPLGHATENKPASAYTGFKYPEGGSKNDTGIYKQPMPNPNSSDIQYATNPNTMSAAESTPGMPARTVGIGNKTRGVKTDGITMRGYGAATKGIKSRGPMA
jgi:hypothetical protein